MVDPAMAALPPFVRISTREEVPEALAALAIRSDRPVLVVVGGAGGMDDGCQRQVEALIRNQLVPVLERHDAAVVDGGTDAGVMRVLGQTCEARLPLLGVAASGTVRIPGEPTDADAADLESSHTGVIVVPGKTWGAESGWIAEIAGQLAGSHPSVTLVINGGEITYRDVKNSLDAQRPVVVLKGTGRTADAIADATACGSAVEGRLAAIVASPLVTVVPLEDPAAVTAAVETAFSESIG